MESFFTQRQLPNPRLHLLSQPRSPQIHKDIRQRSLFIERVRVARQMRAVPNDPDDSNDFLEQKRY